MVEDSFACTTCGKDCRDGHWHTSQDVLENERQAKERQAAREKEIAACQHQWKNLLNGLTLEPMASRFCDNCQVSEEWLKITGGKLA